MSTHVVDKSNEFMNDEQKLKNVINSGFNSNRRCQYEALALKLEFNKIIAKFRQLISEYKDQEFPDIYEHLKMIRTVNQTFQDWMMMNVGDITGNQGIYGVGSPKAKSTPTQHQNTSVNTPQTSIRRMNTPNNEEFKTIQGSLMTPLSRAHERTYRAVRNFHEMLHELQSPASSLANPIKTSVRKKRPTFNVSRTQLPRRRMNFSRSFMRKTPQTQ